MIVGPPYPANEAIAKELARVIENDEEQGRAAWAKFTSENSNPTAKETKSFLRAYLAEPQQKLPPVKPLEERTKRTITYIENVLEEFYPEPPLPPGKKGREGWRPSIRRQRFLMEIRNYIHQQLALAHGAYRGKQKYLRPFEEPSAEYPDGRV